MSAVDSIALAIIMVTLAVMPSTSVALVVTRSATSGVANGVAASLGIVLGDLVFILLAVLGLSVIAETMGGLFMIVKYSGSAYLVWLGITLLRSKNRDTITVSESRPGENSSLTTSFLAGFLLTLGDIKAVFFYISLFPAFVDLSVLTLPDILIIVFIIILTVGGVKIFYVYSARKVVSMARGLNLENGSRKIAGGFMFGAGSYLIVKA